MKDLMKICFFDRLYFFCRPAVSPVTKKILKAAAISWILIPSAAQASPSYTAASLISELNPREYGLDVVLPTGGNPMPCAASTRYRLLTTAANYQVISAVLITAAVQRKTVQVYANSCDGDGVTIILAVIAGM